MAFLGYVLIVVNDRRVDSVVDKEVERQTDK